MSNPLFTIGHSNHDIEAFLRLLGLHGINVIADVRSQPYSGRFPDYSKKLLQVHLANANIRYLYLGDALGARPADRACYTNGAVDFAKLRASDRFTAAVTRVYEGAQRFHVCLLCAEKDPSLCHRAILVGQQAHKDGQTVCHILADGALEPHADLLARISGVSALGAGLFGTDDLFIAALRRQEQRIVFQSADGEPQE